MKWLGTFNINVGLSTSGQVPQWYTSNISDFFCNPLHKHSAALQFKQSAPTLLMEMSAKSPDVKKLRPMFLNLNTAGALQSQRTYETISDACFHLTYQGLSTSPSFNRCPCKWPYPVSNPFNIISLVSAQFDLITQILEITNLTHFSIYLFISCVYVFWVSQQSSGDQNVLIYHLVWLVCVTAWHASQEGVPSWQAYQQSLTQTNHTRWCINTIRSSEDECFDAQNM